MAVQQYITHALTISIARYLRGELPEAVALLRSAMPRILTAAPALRGVRAVCVYARCLLSLPLPDTERGMFCYCYC